MIGPITQPPLPFYYEPGIFDLDPSPILSKISKFSEPVRKLRDIQINTKCQGDTGANVGATHNKQLLWNYRTLKTRIPVITYNSDDTSETSFSAIGIGQCKTVSNDNTVLYWTMLHTPNSTGTILSPDKYMMDNPLVHSFQHEGNKNGTGTINFSDGKGTTIAAIDMKRHHDGLWYTTNHAYTTP
jgi:hypothetical protein